MMKHQIVQIHAGGYSAKINVSRGANCISLRNTQYGATLLREPDCANLDTPYLYGMSLVYPNQRIVNGDFTFDEPSKKWSVLHETPFVLSALGDDYAVCVYRSTKETANGVFPQDFEIKTTYRIDDKGLTRETTITNLSQVKMPNALGFYTTFAIPFLQNGAPQGVRVHIPVQAELERDKTGIATGKTLPNDDITKKLCDGVFMTFERKISRQYLAQNDGTITLTDVKAKCSVVYETDVKCGYCLIDNGNADEYITIAPQTCLEYIAPNESKTYICKLYIREV